MFKNIILIEEDNLFSEILSYHFTEYFGEKINFTIIDQFKIFQQLKEESIDLLLVNYLLISKNIDFMKEFENKVTSNIIIIFDNLKYRNENKNFIDYKFIVKPFTLKNLFSLISNFENIGREERNKVNLLDHLVFLPNEKVIKNSITSKIIHLTEKETYLIQFLFKNKNKFVAKRDLLNNVWGINETINTHTLETHVYRLRKKIEKIEKKLNLIILKEKGGYILKL
tara:strand:+ start:185 stop:862 length:678 start_codon:yes stop_codon:yes gene_type:complete